MRIQTDAQAKKEKDRYTNRQKKEYAGGHTEAIKKLNITYLAMRNFARWR